MVMLMVLEHFSFIEESQKLIKEGEREGDSMIKITIYALTVAWHCREVYLKCLLIFLWHEVDTGEEAPLSTEHAQTKAFLKSFSVF